MGQSVVLKYIELKSGYNDNGPAWIARVKVSKTGRTIYFNGRALKRGSRGQGNFFDLETGESFWVSGVKRGGTDRHWAGSGKVLVEAVAVDEYLSIVGTSELDRSRFVVTHDLRQTDPSTFVEIENKPLVPRANSACPCCRFFTLRERGGFELCKVCFWEDDGQDDQDASVVRGGPNGELSLTQARANFAAFGASDERFKKNVRPPLPSERGDAD